MQDDRVQNWDRQLKRMLDDPDGRELISNALDIQFADPEDKNKPIVAILIPSNRSLKRETEMSIRAMMAYSRKVASIHPPMVAGTSVVHWTRNDLVCGLYRDKIPFTHVLFIDDDMEVQPDSLVKMLSHGKDIVAALTTRRMDPPIPTLRNFDPKTGDVTQKLHWSGQGGLIQVDAAGTGMMLISKVALDRIGEYYLSCEYERMLYYGPFGDALKNNQYLRNKAFNGPLDDKTSLNGFWFQFLPALNGKGEYGEDISFCIKAHFCGIPVYCDTDVTPKHLGDYGYSIGDFFAYKKELIAEAKAAGKYTDEPTEEMVKI